MVLTTMLWVVSASARMNETVAFTEDRTGDGNHTLRLRDLDSGVVTTIAEGVRAQPCMEWRRCSRRSQRDELGR